MAHDIAKELTDEEKRQKNETFLAKFNKITEDNQNETVLNEYRNSYSNATDYAVLLTLTFDTDQGYVSFDAADGTTKIVKIADENTSKGKVQMEFLKYLDQSTLENGWTITITSDGTITSDSTSITITFNLEYLDLRVVFPDDSDAFKDSNGVKILQSNIILNGSLSGKIDLNGKTLYCNGVAVDDDGEDIVIDANGGSIIAKYAVWMDDNGKNLTINGGTYKGDFTICLYPVEGQKLGTVKITDAVIVSESYGAIWASRGGVDNLEVTDTEITAPTCAVYLGTADKAKFNTVTIIVDYDTAMEIKSGVVDLLGGSIQGNGFQMADGEIESSGSGAGIAPVLINNGYNGSEDTKGTFVTIKGMRL